jgi:hypothetical protein
MRERWAGRGPRKEVAPDESAEPPPTALALYAAMMKDDVAPRLRRLGLKGSGGRFHLPSDTCWALLGFQRSAWNDADHVRFTVNLTCVAKAAWEAARETKGLSERPLPNVRYGLFAPSTRIGDLRPDLRPTCAGTRGGTCVPASRPDPSRTR